MTTSSTYVAALLLWAALQLLWQGALALALLAWWERARQPAAAARHDAARLALRALPVALLANALVAHGALVLNARRGPAGALATVPAAERIARLFDRSFDALLVLAALWAAGVVVRALRLALGARQLRRLLCESTPAPHPLVERVHALAREMAVARVPEVRVSDTGLGPFVTGRRRPALVLPSEPMPEDELDALVRHELAHVVRDDYAANVELRAIQCALWFHPAVARLARMAADAREECCDGAAADGTLALARALVRLEERRRLAGAAVAANDGALTRRVKRLLARQAPARGAALSRGAARVATGALLAVGVLMAAGIAPASDRLAVAGALARALPAQRTVIQAHDPAGRFTLVMLNGRVAGATIGGLPIAPTAIHRTRRTVTLRDSRGTALVALEVDPRGAIAWTPRVKLR